MNGQVQIDTLLSGSANDSVVTVSSAGVLRKRPVTSFGGTLSGTTNYVAKFTTGTSVGNSQIFDNGTYVGIGTVIPANQLDVTTAAASINAISGYNSGSTNGTSWGPGTSFSGIMGQGGSGSTQFQAGVFGYQIGGGANSGGVVGAYSGSLWGGLGYTDASSVRWGVYSQGNLHITGYPQIVDGNQAAGKLLTSDASGNGTWTTGTVKVKYCIVAFGVFPTNGGTGNFTSPVIGQIFPFAGNFVPTGCYLCDGSVIPISQDSALFSVIGTTYGGNGTTTFGLPNLIGATPVGY